MLGWGAASSNTGAPVRSAFIQQLDSNVFVVNWVNFNWKSFQIGKNKQKFLSHRVQAPTRLIMLQVKYEKIVSGLSKVY